MTVLMLLSIAALLVTSGISFVVLLKEKPKPGKRWHRNVQLLLTGLGLAVGIIISIRTRIDNTTTELNHTHERSADKQQIAGLTQSIETQTQNNETQYLRNQEEVHRLQDQLTDLKKAVATVEVRKEMDALQSQIDKLLSQPKAKLQPSFWLAALQDDISTEIYAPDDGNVVTFSICLFNHSGVNATGNGGWWIRICDKCKFNKEPPGFQHVEGAPDFERQSKFVSLPAGSRTEKITIEVEVPPTPEPSPKMTLLTKYRCDTCEIESDWAKMVVTVGTIPFPNLNGQKSSKH